MTNKRNADRTFSVRSYSPLITRFQRLFQYNKVHFLLAEMLNPTEMNFIYNLLASAEAEKNFIPSNAQGRWASEILIKIDTARMKKLCAKVKL